MSDAGNLARVPSETPEDRPGALVYSSMSMARVVGDFMKGARAKQDVLVQGESGTGKESMVRSILARLDRSLVEFLVASIPENLQRAEWCGWLRASWSGAERDQPGCVERAAGGVILISDVEQMSRDMQRTLRQFYDERSVQRIGAAVPRRFDAQLVFTTNADLRALCSKNEFLPDLLRRMERVMIEVPPLRERREDLRVLVPHFLERLSTEHGRLIRDIDEPFWVFVRTFAWPGNVRELESYLTDAAVKDDGEVLHLAAVGERVRRDGFGARRRGTKPPRELVEAALAATQTFEGAAALLGIDVRWLFTLRKEYGLP